MKKIFFYFAITIAVLLVSAFKNRMLFHYCSRQSNSDTIYLYNIDPYNMGQIVTLTNYIGSVNTSRFEYYNFSRNITSIDSLKSKLKALRIA